MVILERRGEKVWKVFLSFSSVLTCFARIFPNLCTKLQILVKWADFYLNLTSLVCGIRRGNQISRLVLARDVAGTRKNGQVSFGWEGGRFRGSSKSMNPAPE